MHRGSLLIILNLQLIKGLVQYCTAFLMLYVD